MTTWLSTAGNRDLLKDATFVPDISCQNAFTRLTGVYLKVHAAETEVAGLAGLDFSTEMPLSNGATFNPA